MVNWSDPFNILCIGSVVVLLVAAILAIILTD